DVADAAIQPDDASAPPPPPPIVLAVDGPTAEDAPPPPPDAMAPLDALAPDAAAVDAPGPVEDPAGTCPERPALVLCLRFEHAVIDESPARLAIAPAVVAFADGPSGAASDLGPTTQITLADN